MPTLAETQLFFRDAVVKADTTRLAALLAGGPDSEKGLGIHQRNFEASLVTALLTKFPATAWLTGSSSSPKPPNSLSMSARHIHRASRNTDRTFQHSSQRCRALSACPTSQNFRTWNGKLAECPLRSMNKAYRWMSCHLLTRNSYRRWCCGCSLVCAIERRRGPSMSYSCCL